MAEKSNLNKDKKVLLMADPADFKIEKPFEDGYDPPGELIVKRYKEYSNDPAVFVAKARKQWAHLRDVFNALGVETPILPADPARPEQVFAADSSFSLKTLNGTPVTVFSRFSNDGRQNEVDKHIAYFEQNRPQNALVHSHFRTEGAGDNVYDAFRDVIWSGYTQTSGREGAASGRTDQNAHKTLQLLTGAEVVSLEVEAPYFHIDASVAPLPTGHIVCYSGGMTEAAFGTLKWQAFGRYGLDSAEYLIEVSKEDAKACACNLVCVDDTIVMPACSQKLQDRLKGIGYKVITVDMSQFILAGGGVHCVVNNVNERRVTGGLMTLHSSLKPRTLQSVLAIR